MHTKLFGGTYTQIQFYSFSYTTNNSDILNDVTQIKKDDQYLLTNSNVTID